MQPDDQGVDRSDYTVVPRTLVFLTREHSDGNQEILLLKGAPNKRLWADQYNGIGGHMEAGETPAASARRELEEETGLRVAALDLSGIVHIALPKPPGIVLFVFVGSAPQGELMASEEGTPIWVERERLATLPLVEDLPELLPRVLAAHDAKEIVYATYYISADGLKTEFN